MTATDKSDALVDAQREKPSVRRAALEIKVRNEDHRYQEIARALLRPETNAAGVIEHWQGNTHDVNDLAAELAQQVATVNGGDLTRAEAMLVAQAHTLDNICANLMARAAANMSMDKWEAYMRIALKAQNQSRMTLATLGELKHPRSVAFVRQANIAHGPQQVNNGPNARTEQTETPQNELLEVTDGERLDFGKTCAPSKADSYMEALGAIDRTPDGRREKGVRTERLEGRYASAAAVDVEAPTRATRTAAAHRSLTQERRQP